MNEESGVSFELNEEMLEIMAGEFDIATVVDKFFHAASEKDTKSVEIVAGEIFSRYGAEWIRRSLQLGDEYTDRTYEVLKEAIDSTGGHLRFPLLPQRILEIAYLSTHGMGLLPVYENSPQRLVYRIDDCKMFQTIENACGKAIAGATPCRHACLTACKTLFTDLDYPEARVAMEASTGTDGYCIFMVARR